MSHEQSQVYHLVAYEFIGQDRAAQVVDLIRKSAKKSDFKVKAWAVVEMDEKGKAHVSQSGHGGVGTAAGLGVGALLGLIGGPAGLLIWALGGALLGGIAGKFLGHTFDANELKALTTSMVPNSSAILVIVENKAAEAMAKDMGEYDATVVTLTMGSQISGEMATVAAVDLGEDVPAESAAPAAAEPAKDEPAKA